MWMTCHRGFKTRLKTGKLVWEDRRVNVCAGICDAVDLCGIKDCEFYDDTREGTRRFHAALAHEHTLEGMTQTMELRAIFHGKSAVSD
jgi:hypothetical protein